MCIHFSQKSGSCGGGSKVRERQTEEQEEEEEEQDEGELFGEAANFHKPGKTHTDTYMGSFIT